MRAIPFKLVTEILRLSESCQGGDHVPVIIKGLCFGDLLPSGDGYGEVTHGGQAAYWRQTLNSKCIKKVINPSIYTLK